MTFQTFIFYAFSAILIFAAVGVIIARNPVHSALLLVLAFFTSAGLWVQLQAEFLAIVLVLVYVGAVMVLFLFVVMMLDINLARLRAGFWSYLPLGGVVAVLLAAEMALVLGGNYSGLAGVAAPAPQPPGYSNTKELGRESGVSRSSTHDCGTEKSDSCSDSACLAACAEAVDRSDPRYHKAFALGREYRSS